MLFRRELKRNLKSFLVSTLVCSALVAYVISIAPSFGKDIQQILDLKLPGGMQAAFGMKGLDFTSSTGFFALCFSYIYLFLGIYYAGVFSAIMSKEYSEKTAEFLFSLPVKRTNIIFTKLAVALLYAVLSVILVFLISWVSLAISFGQNYELAPVVMMALAWLIGGLAFSAVAFMVSSFITKTRSASAISVGLVLFFYLFQIVISLTENLEKLKYISPFDWFKGADIAKTGELELKYCLTAMGITIVCFIIGIRRYKKMDVLI